MSSARRHLDWDGCFNVRDVGGLETVDGRPVRSGALVRSDSADRLTAAGWDALQTHGIRTVVDLRFDSEVAADTSPRPSGLTTIRTPPLVDAGDPDFWDRMHREAVDSCPLFYGPFLDRMPGRAAAAVTAVARAEPGGVLVHCAGGRDRTGVITVLLLAAVGVCPGDIADDNELSTARVGALFTTLGVPDDTLRVRAVLERRGTTVRDEVWRLLDGFDATGYLESAGVAAGDLAALRARLIGAPGSCYALM